MRILKRSISILIIFIFSSLILFDNYCSALNMEDDSFEKIIEQIYEDRNQTFLTGNTEKLKPYYDTSRNLGLWSYEHEAKRVNYLRSWAKERGMEFTNVHSDIRIKKASSRGDKKNLFLEESYKFDYIYPDDPEVVNSFGVGIRHTVNLVKKNDSWIIYNDWYTDCFEDALHAYTYTPTLNPVSFDNVSYINSTLTRRHYDREKAVAYADKYCGAAWGSSNNFKYNKKYNDYNGIGGDCTNFISQVLGDKEEGGGLSFDSAWFCSYKKYDRADGSGAWVNASQFKNYIIYSGKGGLIKKGTYKELTTPTEAAPEAAVSKVQPGDLVAYEKKGDIDHFAVITSKDSKGYPLVNSHTTDRYHVPWDLGWGDKQIRFHLIHVRD